MRQRNGERQEMLVSGVQWGRASSQRCQLNRGLRGVREVLCGRALQAEGSESAGTHLRLVLVPRRCWNKIPETRLLKTTEMYCLPVLRLEVQVSVNKAMLPQQLVGENPFLPLPSFWQWPATLGSPCL